MIGMCNNINALRIENGLKIIKILFLYIYLFYSFEFLSFYFVQNVNDKA